MLLQFEWLQAVWRRGRNGGLRTASAATADKTQVGKTDKGLIKHTLLDGHFNYLFILFSYLFINQLIKYFVEWHK